MSSSVDQATFVFAKARARQSATLIQLAAVAGTIVCVVLAALLQTPINTQRKELQLVLQSDLYKELPPKYAWVSAAGGTFRGVAANILWIRAESLKEQGKYYESHQLAKWICTLQPRFPAVWVFQSWNMAYNISVATHTTRERWQWVYNGIRLLRDEGIPNNEKIVPLYHQLAWTWYHKVGERLDDYHMKYKRFWATYMETLLGPPPTHLPEAEQVDWIKPIADAPKTLDALIAQRPGVAKLVADLKDIGVDVRTGTSPSNQFHPLELSFFKPYTAWQQEREFAALRKAPESLGQQTDKIAGFVQAAPPEDFAALLSYLRGKVLREQYKMDPQFMQDMTGRLGTEEPLFIDWRTPWSQAMYWGLYGTDKGEQYENVDEFDILNTDRILLFSLGQTARQGTYLFRVNLEKPENSYLAMSPDWRYVEAIHQMCLALGKKHAEEGEDVGDTAGETLKDYHINTLHSAITGLYFSGREEQARKYFEYLARNYKDQFTGRTKEIYLGSFQSFLQLQIKEMFGSQHEAILLIHSLMESAFMNLANGQMAPALAGLKHAKTLFDSYQENRVDDPEGRRTMPPWPQMVADGLGRFIVNPETPLALRFLVWERFDAIGDNAAEVKRRCYDEVRRILGEMYAKTDIDIDKAFPPPPGMEEWRASHPTVLPEQVAEEANKQRIERDREKARNK